MLQYNTINLITFQILLKKKQAPWLESVNERYRQSDRRFSAKLLKKFSDREYRVVSAEDLEGRNLYFLDRSRCSSFQAALQFYTQS
jgi:hypothetical protein